MNERPTRPRQNTLLAFDQKRDEQTLEFLEGVVDRIVFESADTGFVVARLLVEGEADPVTFVGEMMAITPGDTARLWGHWEQHAQFGRQLRVRKIETVLPSTTAGIEKYLASGLIRGVGKHYAKKLVEAFGAETLRVIDEEPKRLRSVPGIGRKRAKQIRESWAEQRAIQDIMVFLQGHGIPTHQAVRIYKRYGDGALAVLRENPYRLAEDIAGIGFKSADAIAQQLDIPHDAPVRAEAGLVYLLDEAAGNGHCFLPREDLSGAARELLGVTPEVIALGLRRALDSRRLIADGDAVYLPPLHLAEESVADLLRTLLTAELQSVPILVEKAIAWVEKTKRITLSEEQKEAIRTGVEAKVMVITGGPGTGKTTILQGLLDILEKKGLGIVLAAPTGRAAKRMEAATGREARTIHRLLEFSPTSGGFSRNEDNPVDADLVVVDECSMVDIGLMHSLLRAIPVSARLFLVGDVDQLPSVGPGNVLMDVISSESVPVVWLKTVFRQAAESGIISNAHRVNQGQPPVYNDADFFFVERPVPAEARDTVVEVVANRIPRKFGLDPKRDVQVLAPMKRGEAGVGQLNEALRAALNPGGAVVGRHAFGLGDKVMQQRNNYDLDVYNGDVGVITRVDDELQEVQIAFDDGRVALYPFDTLDELQPAYASTVHKSQGSEYPAVVIPLLKQHYMMLQRNVFYTALTRASRIVVIVGDTAAVEMAVGNTRVTRRNTRLVERLRTGRDWPPAP